MKNFTALILVYSLLFISVYSAQVTNKPGPSSSTEIKKPIAISTHAPDNETKAPTTTTSTTTTSTTTISTTEVPKTTTLSPTPPTTNTPPTPVPDPQVETWSISDKNNVIVANMAVQFSITYNTTDEKAKNNTVLINIPASNKTIVSGIFNPDIQIMNISWKSSGIGNNSLSLNFKNNNTTKTYWLSRLEVKIQAEDLPGIDPKMPLNIFHEQGHFNTSIGNSYRCVKLQSFRLTKQNDTQVIGYMKVTDLQFQAFKTGQDTHFGLAEDCAFDTPDIVPIAVGCVLAGLVVIILVGYLITRHRSQARGYRSM